MVKPFLADTPNKRRVAAIDIGSNSIHMLVVDVDPDGKLVVVETAKDQTRLGADLDERLCLDANALAKATVVLKRMRELADSLGAKVRAIGTHALREAKNGVEFCARLSKRTGINIEIVSGQEEARLVYLGVQYGLPLHEKSSLIVDIGGGSTEILVGQWGEERFSTSLKLGAVRLTQKYIKTDPVPEEEALALRRYVDSRIEPIAREIRKVGFDYAVGSSGTIKALKSLVLGLNGKGIPDSFHGSVLSAAELEMARSALEKAPSLKERRMLPNLDPKRADIILAGAYVLESLTRLAGVSSWTISLTAIREGIVIDTLMREGLWLKGNPSDVRWRSVRSFGKRLQIDEAHAWHITSLAVSLFDQLKGRHAMGNEWREYLRCSAYLHEAGRFLGFTGHHKHAHYLIRHSNLLGFTVRELDFVASVVRYHRKRSPRESDEIFREFEPNERRCTERCAAMLRLAASLDRGRLGRIQEIRVQEAEGKCKLTVYLHGSLDVFVEIYEVSIEKQHFEKAFDLPLEVNVASFVGP